MKKIFLLCLCLFFTGIHSFARSPENATCEISDNVGKVNLVGTWVLITHRNKDTITFTNDGKFIYRGKGWFRPYDTGSNFNGTWKLFSIKEKNGNTTHILRIERDGDDDSPYYPCFYLQINDFSSIVGRESWGPNNYIELNEYFIRKE